MSSELIMTIVNLIIIFITNIFIFSMHFLHMRMRELQKEQFKKDFEKIIEKSIKKVKEDDEC